MNDHRLTVPECTPSGYLRQVEASTKSGVSCVGLRKVTVQVTESAAEDFTT